MRLYPLLSIVCTLLVSGLLLASCSPLERQEVPVALGLRIDDQIDPAIRAQDIDNVRDMGIKHIVLELPVEAETKTGLPKINRFARSELKKAIEAYANAGCDITLQFTYFNYGMLFPDSLGPIEPVEWFVAYKYEMDALLQRIEGISQVKRIVLGSDFQAVEAYSTQWVELINYTKSKTSAKVCYAADVRRVAKIGFWKACDEVGIRYYFDPSKDYKVSAQKQNPTAGVAAVQANKPIYLAATNAIGKDKALMFRNCLRFWPEEAQISGVVLNSIYPATALTFEDPYFKIAEDDELRDFLKSYVAQP